MYRIELRYFTIFVRFILKWGWDGSGFGSDSDENLFPGRGTYIKDSDQLSPEHNKRLKFTKQIMKPFSNKIDVCKVLVPLPIWLLIFQFDSKTIKFWGLGLRESSISVASFAFEFTAPNTEFVFPRKCCVHLWNAYYDFSSNDFYLGGLTSL